MSINLPQISLKLFLNIISYLIQDRKLLQTVAIILFELVLVRILHDRYKTFDLHSSEMKSIIRISKN